MIYLAGNKRYTINESGIVHPVARAGTIREYIMDTFTAIAGIVAAFALMVLVYGITG